MRKFLLFLFTIVLMNSCNVNSNGDKINVGLLLPLTGAWSNSGEQMATGAQLWEQNNPNSKLNLIYEDSKSSAKYGISAFSKMLNVNNIDVCITGVTPVIFGISPMIDESGVFTMNVGAINPKIKELSNNLFCVIPDAEVEGEYISNYMIHNLNRKTCSVLWKNDDSGRGIFDSFKSSYAKSAGTIISDFAVENDTEMKSILLNIYNSNVRTIFIATNGENVARIIRQAYSLGLTDILWVSFAAAESPELLETLSALQCTNFIMSSYSFNNMNVTPKTAQFVESYKYKFNKMPQVYAASCYDALSLINMAVEKGDCKTAKEIREYVISLQSYDGASGCFEISNKNYVSAGMSFSMFSEGKILPIDDNLYRE